MAEMEDYREPAYRIGAVSRLTGIAPDTLRMWERRYTVVEPRRADSGTRLYSRDDIQRLALIKRLVDAGHAIGTVASLSVDELQSRLHEPLPRAIAVERGGRGCRMAVLGDALPARIGAYEPELGGIDIVGVYRSRQQFEAEVQAAKPDVLLLECATVHEETGREVANLLKRAGASHVIVVYAFGTQTAVRQLDTSYSTPLRAPISFAELRRLCLEGPSSPTPTIASALDFAAALSQPVPRRMFDSDVLARIAGISTVVRCECPHHLAELVFALSAFERYSAECENRSPEDAALHAYLHATTAQARSLIEQALARVIEAEGIEV